jgi:hypothetical protein
VPLPLFAFVPLRLCASVFLLLSLTRVEKVKENDIKKLTIPDLPIKIKPVGAHAHLLYSYIIFVGYVYL